ncbi:hypothetical protein L1887_03910 [Cichorium endivia]|nr:hypothetical protein L1887_03910 [Cichorium endivia]
MEEHRRKMPPSEPGALDRVQRSLDGDEPIGCNCLCSSLVFSWQQTLLTVTSDSEVTIRADQIGAVRSPDLSFNMDADVEVHVKVDVAIEVDIYDADQNFCPIKFKLSRKLKIAKVDNKFLYVKDLFLS